MDEEKGVDVVPRPAGLTDIETRQASTFRFSSRSPVESPWSDAALEAGVRGGKQGDSAAAADWDGNAQVMFLQHTGAWDKSEASEERPRSVGWADDDGVSPLARTREHLSPVARRQQEELATEAEFDPNIQFAMYELRRTVGYQAITSFNNADPVQDGQTMSSLAGLPHQARRSPVHFGTTSVQASGMSTLADPAAKFQAAGTAYSAHLEEARLEAELAAVMGRATDSAPDSRPASRRARAETKLAGPERESQRLLMELESSLSVLPSAQWVVAHADYHRERVTELRRRAQRELVAGQQADSAWSKFLLPGTRADGNSPTDHDTHLPWYITMLHGNQRTDAHTGSGVTPAEAAIVDSEVMREQTQRMRYFSKQIEDYMRQSLLDDRKQDDRQLRLLAMRLRRLERKEEEEELELDCVASIPNRRERQKVILLQGRKRMESDERILTRLRAERKAILESVVQSIWRLRAESESVFAEGPALLKTLGAVFQDAMQSVCTTERLTLLERLSEARAACTRQDKTDAFSLLHRKLVLNSKAMSPWMRLSHDNFVVTNHQAPSYSPQWGVVAATNGPTVYWRSTVDQQKVAHIDRLISLVRARRSRGSWPALVAKALDATHPKIPGELMLRVRVASRPKRAWSLIAQRRTLLGYTTPSPDVLAFADSITATSPTTAVLDLLHEVRQRLHQYTRFYYEVHFPTTRGSDTQLEWVVGFAAMHGSPHRAVPGLNSSSFGFCHDGKVLFEGVATAYAPAHKADRVVGVLLDLGAPNISLVTRSGLVLPPAFGRGSHIKPASVRAKEIAAILAKPLVPVIAVRALRAKDEGDVGADELVDYPCAAVNFGAYPFVHKPPGAVACDALLEFAHERGSVAAGPPRSVGNVLAAPDAGEVETKETPSAAVRPASRTRSAATPSPAHATSSPASLIRKKPGSRAAAVDGVHGLRRLRGAQKMTGKQKMMLMLDLEGAASNSYSWSHFPKYGNPNDKALRTVQRSVRKWLARRWREKKAQEREVAAFVIQRFFISIMPKFEQMKDEGATSLQRLWRGYCARVMCRLAVKYDRSVEEVEEAAQRIQRLAKQIHRRLVIQEIRTAIDREVQLVEEQVLMIQRGWRRHRRLRQRRQLALVHRAARSIQSVWRGSRARKRIVKLRPRSRASSRGSSRTRPRSREVRSPRLTVDRPVRGATTSSRPHRRSPRSPRTGGLAHAGSYVGPTGSSGPLVPGPGARRRAARPSPLQRRTTRQVM